MHRSPTSTISWLSLVVFGLALAAAPAPASAQEVDLEQIEASRELYETGTQQYKTGKFADAEKSFQRVYDVMHTTSVLFDIGLAQEKQRRWGAAADSFDAFMRGSQRVNNRKGLEKRVAELRKRAGRQADLAAMARPQVRAQGKPGAPGNEVMESYRDEELELGSGEQEVPEVAVVAPVGAPVEPSHGQPSDGKKSRWWIWAVVGGVVVVGAAVGLGVGLGSQQPESPTCPECPYTYRF